MQLLFFIAPGVIHLNKTRRQKYVVRNTIMHLFAIFKASSNSSLQKIPESFDKLSGYLVIMVSIYGNTILISELSPIV